MEGARRPRHERGKRASACEFRLLRYVPDAVRNEYVHIGVILREAGSRERRRCGLPATGAACAAWTGGRYRAAGRHGGRIAPALPAEPDGRLMQLLSERCR